MASPFSQSVLNDTLHEMLTSDRRDEWSANGIRYGQTHDLYGLHEQAAAIIHEYVQTHAAVTP